MSDNPGDNQNYITKMEHDPEFKVKRVTNYKSDGNGNLIRDIADGFAIGAYDYMVLTYVATGNGAGEIETVVYKSGGAGGTTIATLTLAYDGSDNLSSITKS